MSQWSQVSEVHSAAGPDPGVARPRSGRVNTERMSEPSPEQTIQIEVNGQPRQVAPGTTVTGLLAELGLADRRVAVERNREVVPRAEHARTRLDHGDCLEIVTFVGGG